MEVCVWMLFCQTKNGISDNLYNFQVFQFWWDRESQEARLKVGIMEESVASDLTNINRQFMSDLSIK